MTQQTAKNDTELVEVRCCNIRYDPKNGQYYSCNRLLALLPRNVPYQIKCPKCGYLNTREEKDE